MIEAAPSYGFGISRNWPEPGGSKNVSGLTADISGVSQSCGWHASFLLHYRASQLTSMKAAPFRDGDVTDNNVRFFPEYGGRAGARPR
jgi:hypothetical protein